MRAIITVVGKDRVGIISNVSRILADAQINILDISQTIMQNIFTMIMLVDYSSSAISSAQLVNQLESAGNELGVSIKFQDEAIFDSMHRI